MMNSPEYYVEHFLVGCLFNKCMEIEVPCWSGLWDIIRPRTLRMFNMGGRW